MLDLVMMFGERTEKDALANTCLRCGAPAEPSVFLGMIGDDGPTGRLLVLCWKCFRVKADSFTRAAEAGPKGIRELPHIDMPK